MNIKKTEMVGLTDIAVVSPYQPLQQFIGLNKCKNKVQENIANISANKLLNGNSFHFYN